MALKLQLSHFENESITERKNVQFVSVPSRMLLLHLHRYKNVIMVLFVFIFVSNNTHAVALAVQPHHSKNEHHLLSRKSRLRRRWHEAMRNLTPHFNAPWWPYSTDRIKQRCSILIVVKTQANCCWPIFYCHNYTCRMTSHIHEDIGSNSLIGHWLYLMFG